MDVARGSRDFNAPRSAPDLVVRDLGMARDLRMQLGGPDAKAAVQRAACAGRQERARRHVPARHATV
jgi:hypothetical protein